MLIRNPFTPVPNRILDKLIVSDLKKLEHKVMNVILKLSYGCQHRNFCFVNRQVFINSGIGDSKIDNILNGMQVKKIFWKEPLKRKEFKIIINENVDDWVVKTSGNLEKIYEMVGRNLPKKKSVHSHLGRMVTAETVVHSSLDLSDYSQNYRRKEMYKENLNKTKDITIDRGMEPIGDIIKRNHLS